MKPLAEQVKVRLNAEDLRSVKFFRKQLKKNPTFRFFVASKHGNNAKGKGMNRSVILGSTDGKKWYQADKIWGPYNESRAIEIIRQAKLLS